MMPPSTKLQLWNSYRTARSGVLRTWRSTPVVGKHRAKWKLLFLVEKSCFARVSQAQRRLEVSVGDTTALWHLLKRFLAYLSTGVFAILLLVPQTLVNFSIKLCTSKGRVSGDALKTVFFAFGIIHIFWPSDDAYFLLHQPKRYSILYIYILRNWSFTQPFAVKSYGANKCVCWEYHESIMAITANLKIRCKDRRIWNKF